METVDSLRNIISYKEAISSSLLIIKNVVRFRSDRQIAELMDSYHGGVAHKIAQIDLEIRMNGAFENVEANAVANCARDIMAKITRGDKNDLHCTIKILSNRTRNGEYIKVATTKGRSDGQSHRGNNKYGLDDQHEASKNTSFISTMEDAGPHGWNKPMCCFVSNDITKYFSPDSNDRYHYSRPPSPEFRSTMCVPITARDSNQNRWVVGFLTFDSTRKNAFPHCPETFAFRGNPTRYRALLAKIPSFNFASILAHSLFNASHFEAILLESLPAHVIETLARQD